MVPTKVKISVTYTWEITQKEWAEGKEHWVETMKEQAIYDPISYFYCLNNIRWPDLGDLKIEKLS